MSEPIVPEQDGIIPEPKERMGHSIRSLRDLLDHVSGKAFPKPPDESAGLLEAPPFPYLAIVGQHEMKLALLLGLINPAIGGILLIGPRGTAKTTAVRSLLDILPQVERSLCHYGCLPEDIFAGGIDAVCPDCAKKSGEGQPLTAPDRVRLIELPLNARLEDVVGGIDEHSSAGQGRPRIRKGILAQADRNVLYIDEINLLPNEIIDAILDAAAQGSYTVRRGPVSATYRARFMLVGSMNPEEGRLRPQILDRFGLRVIVRGLSNEADRLEAYRRVQSYLTNPRFISSFYADETILITHEIENARKSLPKVFVSDEVSTPAINLIQTMGIDSLRAEITWFEAARAYATADGRSSVLPDDLRIVAPMALRLRRSQYMIDFFSKQKEEETEMETLLDSLK